VPARDWFSKVQRGDTTAPCAAGARRLTSRSALLRKVSIHPSELYRPQLMRHRLEADAAKASSPPCDSYTRSSLSAPARSWGCFQRSDGPFRQAMSRCSLSGPVRFWRRCFPWCHGSGACWSCNWSTAPRCRSPGPGLRHSSRSWPQARRAISGGLHSSPDSVQQLRRCSAARCGISAGLGRPI